MESHSPQCSSSSSLSPHPTVFLPFLHPICHQFHLSGCSFGPRINFGCHCLQGQDQKACRISRRTRFHFWSNLQCLSTGWPLLEDACVWGHRPCWSGTHFSGWRAERESLFSWQLMLSSLPLRHDLLRPQHALSPHPGAYRATAPGREGCCRQPCAVP